MCQLRCLILFLPSLVRRPDRYAEQPTRRTRYYRRSSPVSPCEFDLYEVITRGKGAGGGILVLAALDQFFSTSGEMLSRSSAAVARRLYALTQ